MRRAFAAHVEKNLRPDGELDALRDWGNKLPGNATRLAGLLHFFASDSAISEPISGETMLTALKLSAILVDHAKAAFALMGEDASVTAAKRVLEWIVRNQADAFTGRECWQGVRGRFSKMEEVNAALNNLEERGYVARAVAQDSKKPGRPSQVWKAHPQVIGGVA